MTFKTLLRLNPIFIYTLFITSTFVHPQEITKDSQEQFKFNNEWVGFDYQEMGLTQFEFQKVKESGMTREKLTHLLEIGIYPREYFKKPWLKLGVDEDVWIEERSEGMSDEDIDRSYELATKGTQWAWTSVILPSYYQWKTRQSYKAVAINVWTAGTVGSFVAFEAQNFKKRQ